ncbi:MAG: hypothetical protein HZR80_03580 [Candidatus Heimdallarchaeota archaeon]
MAETQLRKIITLIGRLETPIILSKPFIKKHGCWIKVIGDPKTDSNPAFTPIGKVVSGEQRTPTVMRAYRGYLKITYMDSSMKQAREKAEYFLSRRFLGSKKAEGYGRIKWLSCSVVNYVLKQNHKKSKLKFRKGLGVNYPKNLQRLLLALMLHDFVHTEKHLSKIYEEVNIEDAEIRESCINHHNGCNTTNPYHTLIQYYDRFASFITRKTFFQTTSRYDIRDGAINFKELALEIEKRQSSAYKLYNYIYHSKELMRIVESMSYSKNNLRNHLLLMVNLAINDYLNGKLVFHQNGKIRLQQSRISTSATKDEEVHLSAMDAEMHSPLTMSNADSESATNSKKRRLGT